MGSIHALEHGLRRSTRAFGAWVLCVCAVAAGRHAAAQDSVKLLDGREVEGRVVHESKERVVVRIQSKERELAAAQIAEIRSVARSLRQALELWRKAPATSASAVMDIARFCRSSKLEGEAQVFAWMALSLDPRCAPAHEFLAHELRSNVWHVRGKQGSTPYDEYVLERRDFTDAWRLGTLHFALRTNLPLDQACAAALELELGYEAFTRWMGEHVELFEVTDPIAVQIHADKASYPGGDAQPGYYSPELYTAFLNAEKGFEPAALIHEATHGILASTATRTRKALGSIPPWLNEALADAAGYGRSGELARAEYDFTRKVPYYFQIHTRAAKPMGLERVVTLSTRDFVVSGHVGLSYAQAHTLLQFALRGAEGAHSDGLWSYVRSCYAGKSSITDFKAALGVREDQFESAWHAFAKSGG